MLNLLDKATEEQILDNLEERDPDLAEQIRQLMFVFDDLVKIDDRGIQELVKNVKTEQWKVALKTASESVAQLIFKNMSERAAKMLKEDMEAMAAVKLSDVESMQFEIVQICRKLEEEGKIVIFAAGTGNPFFTTDTAAALRGTEMGCDIVLKATKVDGVYSADPKTNPQARRYARVSFDDAINQNLKVMDATALTLCRDQKLPINVFSIFKAGALKRVVMGEDEGTLVHS